MTTPVTQLPLQQRGVTYMLRAIGMHTMAQNLLTNGYRSPMPQGFKNQRQKRKQIRQTNGYSK